MPPVRFELTTPGLRDQCSATELQRQIVGNCCPWQNRIQGHFWEEIMEENQLQYWGWFKFNRCHCKNINFHGSRSHLLIKLLNVTTPSFQQFINLQLFRGGPQVVLTRSCGQEAGLTQPRATFSFIPVNHVIPSDGILGCFQQLTFGSWKLHAQKNS